MNPNGACFTTERGGMIAFARLDAIQVGPSTDQSKVLVDCWFGPTKIRFTMTFAEHDALVKKYEMWTTGG